MVPSTRAIQNLQHWLNLNSECKLPWWQFYKRNWHKGYTQACIDALILLDSNRVVILPLSEYKSLEGYYAEVHGADWPYP